MLYDHVITKSWDEKKKQLTSYHVHFLVFQITFGIHTTVESYHL